MGNDQHVKRKAAGSEKNPEGSQVPRRQFLKATVATTAFIAGPADSFSADANKEIPKRELGTHP